MKSETGDPLVQLVYYVKAVFPPGLEGGGGGGLSTLKLFMSWHIHC